jgi:DNA-binding GntR family transcriptional regulator
MEKKKPLLPFDGVDVSKAGSASSIVFETLRQAIIEGRLVDGTPLRQEELAKKFNTSRIPIRESISRLEQEGFVQTVRYKGAIVAGISYKEVEEMFDLRALIEGEVIYKAVLNMGADTLEQAERYCEKFAESQSPEEWTKYNRLFHCSLYSAANLSFHMSIIHSILDRTERYLRAQLVLSNGMHRAITEHQQLLVFCRNKNAAAARTLTLEHVDHAKLSLLEFLKET